MALANRAPRLASPLLTLAAREGIPEWRDIDRLISEWRPSTLVVGVPYNGAAARVAGSGANPGTDSESAAERFAGDLRERYGLPVVCVDERLTSLEAEARLREQRRSGTKKRKVRTGDVDALAACVIAESWLDDR